MQPDVDSALPDLATLTGVRSGKPSYYRQFQLSTERMQRTVRAMDSISRALVRPTEGPRALIEEVVRAAADHLRADWMMLVLADGAIPDSRPRFLAVDDAGHCHVSADRLPDPLPAELSRARAGVPITAEVEESGWIRVGMILDGAPVGTLVGRHRLPEPPDEADLSVLRILANQAAVSMHTSDLHRAGFSLRRRAQRLYDEVEQRARDLAVRTDELRAAEQRLRVADQRELLDGERHRIALELHDSVSQFVLSAGLAIDVCRAEASGRPGAEDLTDQLQGAKDLIGRASEQLRSVIYALHHSAAADDVASLPDLLQEMADQHRPHLSVGVRVEGRPLLLGSSVEHALARIAGEALFNVAMHAQARRAALRLRYTSADIALFVSDDGTGDPIAMRRQLRLAAAAAADGRHRGLANMAARTGELGGVFSIRRSTLGGVRIGVRIPNRADARASAGSLS